MIFSMMRYAADQLHQRLLSHRIVQGPLAGVSSVPFRDLVWRYSQPAWVYSEMISCRTIISGSPLIKHRYLQTSAQEGPLCMQIATDNPEDCAKACAVLNQLDIAMIDLNVGCPVKKIRQRQQGSYLLSQPDRLYAIVRALRTHSVHPISVKIRVDGSTSDRFNADVLDVINRAAPDFLVVHGRNYQEGYDVACHYDQIAFFAQHAHMPVIGNGDVHDQSSVEAMLALGCAGAMIARASVGAPWLIGNIQSHMGLGLPTHCLSLAESWSVFCAHINGLVRLLGREDLALAQAQGLIKYYAKRNPQFNQLLAPVRNAVHIETLPGLLAQLD